jgi:mono/diheme cytochrome c family protein
MRRLLLLSALALPGAAWAQPVAPDQGRALALLLCSACHLVSPAQRGPVPDGVPSFMAIAARPETSEDGVLAALIVPRHPQMPQPPLDRRQMRDVAAYILSLRRP